jgi:cytochrome P450
MTDPFPEYAELRTEGPVVYVPDLDIYVVSRYADVAKVLEDRDDFLSIGATLPFRPVCPAAQTILAGGFPRKPTFTNCDPPRHPKMRMAASRSLSAKRWAKAQPAIRAYAEDLVEKMGLKPVADLVNDLAFPLPAFAGFNLLGFPPEDTDKLRSWCGPRVALTYGDLTPEGQVQAANDLVDFWEYVRAFVELRLSEPGDDLTTDLLEFSRQRPDDLSTEDVVNMVYGISLAAHETTTAGVLNGLQLLLADRAQWQAICDDPALIPGAVDELLRINSPLIAIRRTASRDVEFGDVLIPKGATVLVLLASANRDDRRFEDGGALDIRRENAAEHVAFGHMWHLCLGAPLARFEIGLVLELLSQKLPDIRLVGDQTLTYPASITIRSPAKMLVTTGAAG